MQQDHWEEAAEPRCRNAGGWGEAFGVESIKLCTHPSAAPAEVIYCKGKGVFILLQCSRRRLGVCNRKSRKQTAAPQGRDRWGRSGLTGPNLVGRQRGALSWQSSGSAEEEFAFSHTQEYMRSKYFIFSSFPLKGKS